MRKRWVLLALALPLPTVAYAQTGAPGGGLDPQRPISQYLHDVWTIDQGLPQNGILAIAQGRDGYLWLGTEEGLARFDGLTFTVIDRRTAPELRNPEIRSLVVFAPTTMQYSELLAAPRPPGEKASTSTYVVGAIGVVAVCAIAYAVAAWIRRRSIA